MRRTARPMAVISPLAAPLLGDVLGARALAPGAKHLVERCQLRGLVDGGITQLQGGIARLPIRPLGARNPLVGQFARHALNERSRRFSSIGADEDSVVVGTLEDTSIHRLDEIDLVEDEKPWNIEQIELVE